MNKTEPDKVWQRYKTILFCVVLAPLCLNDYDEIKVDAEILVATTLVDI